MSRLTHREYLHRIMQGKPTDWAPNYELGCWGQTIDRWLREGLPAEQVYLGDMFEGEPFFKLDRRNFARLDIGMIPGFEYQVIEETDRYLTARNVSGIVTRALKEGTVRGTRLCMDEHLDFPVKDRESWRGVKRRYDPKAPVRYPFWWDELARLWKRRDYPVGLLGNGTFGLYGQLRRWVGTERLSYLFYDEPALVEEMIEFNADFFLQLVERALRDVPFDYFNFFEDCAGKGGPLYGPNLFRRFFQKPYQRIIEFLHKNGIRWIWLDCDGDPGPLIPLWMEVGINCLWPLEQASGMDPRKLRKKYGCDLILAGGIDKLEIAKGPQAIEKELRAKIPPLLEQGGYLPHLDHGIPPDISYDNFRYYLDLKLKLMGR